MQQKDPTTPPRSSDISADSTLPVSYTEFYDEREMTQEIEALTLISNTQEMAAISSTDDPSPS